MWRNYLMNAKSIRLIKKAISNYLLKTQFSFKTRSRLKWKRGEGDRPWESNACVSREGRHQYTSPGTLTHFRAGEPRRQTSINGDTVHRRTDRSVPEATLTALTGRGKSGRTHGRFHSLLSLAERREIRKNTETGTDQPDWMQRTLPCQQRWTSNRTHRVWSHKVGPIELHCLEARNRSSLITSRWNQK